MTGGDGVSMERGSVDGGWEEYQGDEVRMGEDDGGGLGSEGGKESIWKNMGRVEEDGRMMGE